MPGSGPGIEVMRGCGRAADARALGDPTVAFRRDRSHLGRVKKHVLLYGLVGGLLVALLQLVEYRWLIVARSVEIYSVVIAALFAAVGIWLGVRLTRARPVRETVVVREVETREVRVEVPVEVRVPVEVPATPATPAAAPAAPAAPAFVRDAARVDALGLTPRELEILELIAQGLSNREIAERLFVSENTVKTHSSRLFVKLGAKRRTQAVQLGKQHALID